MATNFKERILFFLKNRPGRDVSRELLCREFKISTSRLSEILASIRDDGYTIITPPRSGIVRLEVEQDQMILSDIKGSDIRKLWIIFVLSKFGSLTFKEILSRIMELSDDALYQTVLSTNGINAYDNAAIINSIRSLNPDSEIDVAEEYISVTAYRNDLKALCDQKLITTKYDKMTRHTKYTLTSKAPSITSISGENLYTFCNRYENSASSVDKEPARKIYDKIRLLINMETDSISHDQFGRTDRNDSEQEEKYYQFIDQPYNTNILEFDYRNDNVIYHIRFETGLIFYRKDISKYFVLGTDLRDNKCCSLRLDRISNIQSTDAKNEKYLDRSYEKIYQEMFLSTYEDTLYDVKVLVMDYHNEPDHFKNLSSVRGKNARFSKAGDLTNGFIYTEETHDNGGSKTSSFSYKYIYEDKIRGLSDFADYLSAFGFVAIAIQPPELRLLMTEKLTKQLRTGG